MQLEIFQFIVVQHGMAVLLSFKINTSILNVYFKYTSKFEKKLHQFEKSTSCILLNISLNINTWVQKEKVHLKHSEFENNASIQKVYFKYTFNFECKFVSLKSLLQVYFWVWQHINFEILLQVNFWPRKEIQMHFKNRFKVYLKYTSLLNTWCTQSILETYKSKLFFNYFHKITNFGSWNISRSILEVYFIFRVQKYIWSIAQFQQDKILTKVYITYGAMT